MFWRLMRQIGFVVGVGLVFGLAMSATMTAVAMVAIAFLDGVAR